MVELQWACGCDGKGLTGFCDMRPRIGHKGARKLYQKKHEAHNGVHQKGQGREGAKWISRRVPQRGAFRRGRTARMVCVACAPRTRESERGEVSSATRAHERTSYAGLGKI